MAKLKSIFKKRRRPRSKSMTEIPARRSPIPINISAIKRQLQLKSNSFSIFSRPNKKLLKRNPSLVTVASLQCGFDDRTASNSNNGGPKSGEVVSIRLIKSTTSCRSGVGSHLPDMIKLGIVAISFLFTVMQSIAVIWVIGWSFDA